jgi:DNA-binding GntR family transcriptional regulator
MSITRYVALFFVSLTINEVATQYFSNRLVLLGWALACLWILFDASLVAVQLTHTEALLKAQNMRNDAMYEQNAAFSQQLLHTTDNHVLLSEIRTKLGNLTNRLKEHHEQFMGDKRRY